MAAMVSGPNQGLLQLTHRCKCFFPCGRCRGVLGIVISPDQQTEKLCNTLCRSIDAIRSESELKYFHTLCRNANSITTPTCDVLLRRFRNMLLYVREYVVAYSYLLRSLGVTCAAKRIKQLSKRCDVCCTILYLCCVGLHQPSVLWPQSHRVHPQSRPCRQVDLSSRLLIPARECQVVQIGSNIRRLQRVPAWCGLMRMIISKHSLYLYL